MKKLLKFNIEFIFEADVPDALNIKDVTLEFELRLSRQSNGNIMLLNEKLIDVIEQWRHIENDYRFYPEGGNSKNEIPG